MLDHDALSFSLVPFCYGVCPFVNQLHPLPSATSGIPDYPQQFVVTLILCIFINRNKTSSFLFLITKRETLFQSRGRNEVVKSYNVLKCITKFLSGNTSLVFLVLHLSNFPSLAPQAGMTNIGTRPLGKEKFGQFVLLYTRANKTCQGKVVKENLFVCTGLTFIILYIYTFIDGPDFFPDRGRGTSAVSPPLHAFPQ